MSTNYPAIIDDDPEVITRTRRGVERQAPQCCPQLTRFRLMAALGISMATIALLLLQCLPSPSRYALCCRDLAALNRAIVVKTIEPSDVENGDVIYVDAEYSERNEGGDRVHNKRTKRRLPQCIIIGVRKAGTRALLQFLDLHPAIAAQKQEMHFFDDDEHYARGLAWYRKRMPRTRPEQVTIEKTPAYFVESAVPERVRDMDRSTKLLLILRDPIERAISDYVQIHSTKSAKGKYHESFDELVIDPDTGQVDADYRPIERSVYHKHLSRWLEYFSLSQLHIVNGENLIRDPVAELRKVETFLGLDHRISAESFYYNKTKGFYCMRLQRRQKCLSPSKGRRHPDISPTTMKVLREFFRPLNSKLYDMIGVNFGWN